MDDTKEHVEPMQSDDATNRRLVRGLSMEDLKEIARVLELLRSWGEKDGG